MKMRSFSSFVQSTSLCDGTLKDCPVIIDGHNFFFKTYECTKHNFLFGCESDNYARYLKNYLSMFKRANVQCYFVFKGGNEDHTDFRTNYHHKEFVFGEFVPPMFAKDVCKEVLDEMGFDYVYCEFESKKECMALAQKLDCAIVSDNIEYCFSGIDYIPHTTMNFNEDKECIDCRIFTLDNFLSTHELIENDLSILIILTDLSIFPDGYFKNFMISQKISTHYFHRFSGIVKWLSKQNAGQALTNILKLFSPEDKSKILEEEIKARTYLKPCVAVGLPSKYLTEEGIEIQEKDTQWFEKGVVTNYIPMEYVNLYNHGVVLGSWPMQDQDEDDAVLLSMDIIKYAYNLMTNYRNDEIKLMTREHGESLISLEMSVTKPNYEAENSVFENGWREIKDLKMFEHFLHKALPVLDVGTLAKLPEDVQLLMIALIYYSNKKRCDAKNVAYSVLLSYVALKCDENLTKNKLDNNLFLVDMKREIELASKILKKYFSVDDATSIFDVKLNHAMLEFQYCLKHLNCLNKLCGMPYKSTIYSKTYNGTFVYKILHTIVNDNYGYGLSFIERELRETGTVLDFFHQLLDVYHQRVENEYLYLL